MAGPLANIIVASVTLPLYYLLFETQFGAIIGFICLINTILAVFNLLPFGPLDGVKIIRWSATVWVLLLIVTNLWLVAGFLAIISYVLLIVLTAKLFLAKSL